jgi:hypothetical protein
MAHNAFEPWLPAPQDMERLWQATATLLLFGMMWPPDTLRIRQHREKHVFADTSNGFFRRSGARANFLRSVGNRWF